MLPCEVAMIVFTAVLLSTVNICETYIFRIEPLISSTMEGEAVTLVCEVAKTIDDEEYILIWEKDGVIVAQEHSVLGPTIQPGHRIAADLVPTTSGFMYVLKIDPVKAMDGGNYACLAEERMKKRTKSPRHATLIINQVPRTQYPKCLSEFDSSGYPEGKKVTITCVSEIVVPEVNLQWQQDGKAISSRMEKDVKNGLIKAHYTFTPKPDDSGNKFACNMTSPAIIHKHRQCKLSPLTVLYKPITSIRKYSEFVYVGKESVFICESIANPRSTIYEWTFSEELMKKIVIDEETRRILRLKDPSLSDEGCKITCVATNSMGSSSASLTIHVRRAREELPDDENPPSEPSGLYDYSVEGDFLGVPTSIAILGLTGIVIFILFITITPVCYCCFCHGQPGFGLPSSKENVAQLDYSVPQDYHICYPRQVPTSENLAPWTKSVGSQIPDDWDVHYSEIGGARIQRPMSLTFPKCSCV